MLRARPFVRFFIGFCAVLAQLTTPLEAQVPDAHDGDASVVRIEDDGSRHEHDSRPEQSSHDDHALHICHCVHSHSGIVVQQRAVVEGGSAATDLPALQLLALPAPAPSEFFRPPIA